VTKPIEVRVDRDECISCGVCWSTCPEVFEENPDDGLTQIVDEYRIEGALGAGGVPAALEDCAREAADDCPVEVIHVAET
jgi:ferredoxin